MTGNRWDARGKRPGDLTGMRGAQLVAERDARTKQAEAARRIEEERSAYRTPDELVSEVQATLKSGVAFWNEDTGEVEVSYAGSYR